MKIYKKHIFICENKREGENVRECCANKNGAEIRNRFKELIKTNKLNATVRANSAGCLDQCEKGAVIVVYPEEVWYSKVTLDDVDEIFKEHIVGNRPVKRLLMK